MSRRITVGELIEELAQHPLYYEVAVEVDSCEDVHRAPDDDGRELIELDHVALADMAMVVIHT